MQVVPLLQTMSDAFLGSVALVEKVPIPLVAYMEDVAASVKVAQQLSVALTCARTWLDAGPESALEDTLRDAAKTAAYALHNRKLHSVSLVRQLSVQRIMLPV